MKPDVSIVVPAFDEQDRLGASIERILQYLSADDAQRTELIVVDDGSTDRTSEIAELAAASFPLITTRVIRYKENRGKGYAVKTGLLAANADIAVFSDADLSTPIDEIDKLVRQPHQQSSSKASDEGVQYDLLPMLDGTSISVNNKTRIKTKNILFVGSGTFEKVKPTDLILEL